MRVAEKDFRIVVRPKRVPAGPVRFVLSNKGPVTHELVIIRGLRSHLPLRSDALTVDDEELPGTEEIEGIAPGKVGQLRLRLAPGRYQLICNMAGHFMAGMHAELVVR